MKEIERGMTRFLWKTIRAAVNVFFYFSFIPKKEEEEKNNPGVYCKCKYSDSKNILLISIRFWNRMCLNGILHVT